MTTLAWSFKTVQLTRLPSRAKHALRAAARDGLSLQGFWKLQQIVSRGKLDLHFLAAPRSSVFASSAN